ncbi:probable E3 ubiquitin-protein ligase DTX3 [Montipora capricornis]|uniref:probable E3 ubiquitin-protein ligase DTX3 n=1 Tax=Montipora capricornis TaxID=246305 RepID=UPI0035F1D5D9
MNAVNDQGCAICLHNMSNPRSLTCKHAFCSACIQQALNVCNRCPVCQEPQGVLRGNQPPGVMTNRVIGQSVPGYEGYGTIIINYSFSSGIQGREHPNPGQNYSGTNRQAYLPDTREGREVLQLLKRAFDARLVFTVGTSVTTGLQNQITWNDIHHKTSTHGGPFGFGYPDPDYLRRVKEDLAAKGIR